MLKDHREQRIATLMADLQDRILDVQWLDDMSKKGPEAAKAHYAQEYRKENAKLEKVRDELIRLRARQ
jgi:hypothetical protein